MKRVLSIALAILLPCAALAALSNSTPVFSDGTTMFNVQGATTNTVSWGGISDAPSNNTASWTFIVIGFTNSITITRTNIQCKIQGTNYIIKP